MKTVTFDDLLIGIKEVEIDLSLVDNKDIKTIYLYLNIKSAVVTNDTDYLKHLFKNPYYFYQNSKILLELLNDRYFANTFEDEIYNAVKIFSYESRNFIYESQDEKTLVWETVNDILTNYYNTKKLSGEYKKFFNLNFLVEKELEQRNITGRKYNKIKKQFLNNYNEQILKDSIVFDLYALCQLDEEFYLDSVTKSIEPNLNKIKYLEEHYKHDKLFTSENSQKELKETFERIRKFAK